LEGLARRAHLAALRRVDVFVAYGAREAEVIDSVLGRPSGIPVVFVPFGVDTSFFQPLPVPEPDFDVVSIGADPHRDYPLLLRVAERRRDWRVRLVVAPEQARALGAVPPNVEVETGLPFGDR